MIDLDEKYNILDEETPPYAPLSAKHKRLVGFASIIEIKNENQNSSRIKSIKQNKSQLNLQEFCILYHSGASSDHFYESY